MFYGTGVNYRGIKVSVREKALAMKTSEASLLLQDVEIFHWSPA